MGYDNWRPNLPAAKAVFMKLTGDVLAAELRAKTLLDNDYANEHGIKENYIEEVIESLNALGTAQQRLFALKKTMPSEQLPVGVRTPFDQGSGDYQVGQRHASIGEEQKLNPGEVERQVLRQALANKQKDLYETAAIEQLPNKAANRKVRRSKSSVKPEKKEN